MMLEALLAWLLLVVVVTFCAVVLFAMYRGTLGASKPRTSWGPPPLSPLQCSACQGYGYKGKFVTKILPSEVGPISVQEWELTGGECPECVHGLRREAFA